MSKEYKNYSLVPPKYKFDLVFLLEGKTMEQAWVEIEEFIKKSIKIKDSKYNSKREYLEALKLDEKIEIKSNKLINYVYNRLSINVVDPKITAFSDEIEFKMYELNKEIGPEAPRFYSNLSSIKKWLNEKDMEPYRKNIKAMISDKKHQLPKAIQEFRQISSRADVSTNDIFNILTNSELDFGYATSLKGKKIKVNEANRLVLSKHKDKMIRKTSMLSSRDAYLKHKGTLSNLLYQHFKVITTWSKLNKFNKTVDSLLHSDRFSEKMLLSLYESVQKSNKVFTKYYKNWNKFYKAKFKENPTKFDKHVDLIKIKTKYEPEEAIKIVRRSLKNFGSEYVTIYDKLIKEKWIDFMPVKNKRSGAYSIGDTYGIDKKLICMNFDGTFSSVLTLAHEVGHSMHSYFSDKKQHQVNSQYPIFLAEIASIFNELMLYDEMLNSSKKDEFKFYIYEKIISGFRGTVLKQVEWSNFEYDMYSAIESGQPVSSYDAISKLYYENSKKYKTKKEKFDPKDSWMGVVVPHFYFHFYVYKYAIGQICAMIFFEKYKQEGPKALQLYINEFLSAGSRDWPIEILKDANIDLTNDETYELCFKRIEKYIDEWVKIGNKIFKTK